MPSIDEHAKDYGREPVFRTNADQALLYKLALEKIANYSSDEKEHIVQAYLTVLKIAKDAIDS